MSSVYVVCWIFLQTFQTYFCIQANSVDPDQTAPKGKEQSDLGAHCLQKWQNPKQMTKQTTIVVTGALRVNVFWNIHANECFVEVSGNMLSLYLYLAQK